MVLSFKRLMLSKIAILFSLSFSLSQSILLPPPLSPQQLYFRFAQSFAFPKKTAAVTQRQTRMGKEEPLGVEILSISAPAPFLEGIKVADPSPGPAAFQAGGPHPPPISL